MSAPREDETTGGTLLPAETPPPESLGRYRILGELGRGAMGVVYKAADPMLNRTVALKTINVTGDAAERAEYEARFYQEARAAGGLNHPNIVTIYDIGQAGQVVYMAMEYIEGTELRDLVVRGRLPLALALDIGAQIAEGLAFAHERGVIHRDIKPANIMVVRGQLAKVMDFGIARMRSSELRTQTGLLLGSPKYMSPEQIVGERIDHRCDIFALGVVLYETLTGSGPFPGSDVTSMMYQIVHGEPPAPSRLNPEIPGVLDLIVAKALAKDPELRYADARDLATDLRACLGDLPEPGPAPAHVPPAPSAAGTDPDAEATVVNANAPPLQAETDDVEATVAMSATGAPALGAAGAGTTFTPGRAYTGPRLRLSRRFDSLDAARTLAERSGVDANLSAFARTVKLDLKTAASAPHAHRGRNSEAPRAPTAGRDRIVLAASVTIALLVALAIALT